MDKNGYITLVVAICLFGIVCFLFGFLFAKAYPLNPEIEKDDSEMTFSNEKERIRYRIRRRAAIQAIHYRRDGIFVFSISLIALVVLWFSPNFVFPDSSALEKMDDFIHIKIKMPWGNIYLFALIAAPILSIVYFYLAHEFWKTRRNDYFRPLFFLAAGLASLFWGIFQWGSH